jgi:hypothetical protein
MLSSTAQHSLSLASQRTFHVLQQQRILSSSLSNCMHFFSAAPAAAAAGVDDYCLDELNEYESSWIAAAAMVLFAPAA